MKAVVAAFNQEKALVGAFSVIVQPVVEPMDRFAALLDSARSSGPGGRGVKRRGPPIAGAGGGQTIEQERGRQHSPSHAAAAAAAAHGTDNNFAFTSLQKQHEGIATTATICSSFVVFGWWPLRLRDSKVSKHLDIQYMI